MFGRLQVRDWRPRAMVSKTGRERGSTSGIPFGIAILVGLVSIAFAISRSATYVFDPQDLQDIARKSITAGDGNTTKVLETVEVHLRKQYGSHVATDPARLFNNAGGAMGTMTVLHCSLSEYVIIFGTALGTEGHTGRFLADDYFTILVGEQWASLPTNPVREVYRPGDQHHLAQGVSKQYKCPGECWALEYARGNILSMIPFGLADTFSSTLDFPTLAGTIRASLGSMLRELFAGKI